MQVCSDMEDIVHSVTSSLGLQNCAVAIYNIENNYYSIAEKIKAICTACGAMYSHVFMVTSVLRIAGKCIAALVTKNEINILKIDHQDN